MHTTPIRYCTKHGHHTINPERDGQGGAGCHPRAFAAELFQRDCVSYKEAEQSEDLIWIRMFFTILLKLFN